MNLSCLLPLIRNLTSYKNIIEQLSSSKSTHETIVLNAARACVIASLYHDSNIPIIVITTQPEAVKKLYSELQAWCLPSTNLHSFPELEFSPYEYNSYYSNDTTRERLSALSALTLYNQTPSPYNQFGTIHHKQDSRPRGFQLFLPYPEARYENQSI
jgi:transcription-repair coupling factor (superfamily II helicase)